MGNGIQVGLDINAYSIFVCVVLHILYTKKKLTHQKIAVIRRNLRFLFQTYHNPCVRGSDTIVGENKQVRHIMDKQSFLMNQKSVKCFY